MCKKNLKFFTLIFFLVVLDQVSKFIFQDQVTVNLGVSFGLDVAPYVTIGLSLVFIGIGFYLLVKRRFFPFGISLVLAGAISNLIDRVFYSGVRDFLGVPFFNLTNNLADWMIVVGISLIVVKSVKLNLKK